MDFHILWEILVRNPPSNLSASVVQIKVQHLLDQSLFISFINLESKSIFPKARLLTYIYLGTSFYISLHNLDYNCTKYFTNSVMQGTFNPNTGLSSVDQCTACIPGQYCDSEGLNATSGSCDPGYYCPAGQNSSRPESFPCTLAHYCPSNSSEPLPCAEGTYMNHTHGAVCYTCEAGW